MRLAVTKRKVCGGSRSMVGFAQTARLTECDSDLSDSRAFGVEFLETSFDGDGFS